jgi:hypothetical protein
MVQINDDYYEDLTPENFALLLDNLAAGKPVSIGSQTGRRTSEPVGGLTSLLSLYGVDGRSGPDSGDPGPSHGAETSAPRSGETLDPVTADVAPAPAEPAMARETQEEAHSAGSPDKVEDTGTSRTEPPVSAGAHEEHKAAQEAAKGAPADTPSVVPGHEPSDGEKG